MNTKSPSSILHDSGWNAAKSYVTAMGNFNNSLTQVTKVLERQRSTNEEGSTNDEVDQTCYFMMRTLLANHRFRANLYYALLTLYADEHDSSTSLTAKQLIKKFKRSEHSAIAAAVFAYKLARSAADPEHQPEIDKDLQECAEVGMLAARSISQVGAARGLILGMIRHVAFAAFSKQNPNAFSKYRSHLRKQKMAFDLQYEQESFGCQYPQIASLIIQKLGFTRDFSQNSFLALATNIHNVSGEVTTYRETAKLIDHIVLHEDIPNEAEVNYSALGDTRQALLEPLKQALKIRTTGSLHAWMSKTDKDISAANNPDLFEENPRQFFDDDFDFGAVPAAVREEFSMEDFASFRKAIQEILEE